jgi:hypothetical protein
MKIDYLRRRNGRRVVTFATATPIANSVTEAHVMQRYLRPDLLDDAGIGVFDTWAATFGQVVSQVELAPEGGSNFRMKSRFARFANVPEMLRTLHVAADVKTAEDLALPVPDLKQRDDGQRAPQTVAIEPSGELLDYVRDLGGRATKVRNRAVRPDEDNMLKISGDGRRAALDLRLLGLPQTTPGKIAAAADRITAIWAAHDDDEYFDPDGIPYPGRGSLQLVFCDLGTPGPGWNVYDELRGQLVVRGLPPEKIRFIHEAKTDRDKARLFAACRTGAVAVLVGSTEKMGVGTNVQDRAIALHHLDAPWRPADVAQREGRILRQGNLNRDLGRDVEIIRYVTERSFDGYMWQTLERKARFIGQVMHGRLDTREIADIGDTALSFSEVKAIATGNPLLMDKADADAALARLQRAERAHLRNQDALRYAIAEYETEISRLTILAGAVGAAITRRQDTRGDKFTAIIDGTHQTKRADAGQHVKHILERETPQMAGQLRRAVSVGSLGGFTINAEMYRSLGTTTVTINLEGAPGTTIDLPASGLPGADPVGLITRLEHRLAELETRKAKVLADIDHARRQMTHARGSIGQPFPHTAELAAARTRVRGIDEALDRMARDDAKRAEAAAGQEAGDASSHREPGAPRTETETGTTRKTHPPSGPHVSAQREQANRAAVAANEAYRAGDLDQARQLVDRAAALDPSRAGLWQQHRDQIAARRLILDAQAAGSGGDQQRAQRLLNDARQIDPRMPAVWNGDLQPTSPTKPARQVNAQGATQPEGHTPQPSWPSLPARGGPQRPAASQVDGTHSWPQKLMAAAPGEPRARPGASPHTSDASTELADSDPATQWPAPNPRAARKSDVAAQPAKHGEYANQESPWRQQAHGAKVPAEPSGTASPEPSAPPPADWRDEVLNQARQPWQPAPSRLHHPVMRRPPEADAPDAMKERGLLAPRSCPGRSCWGCLRHLRRWEAPGGSVRRPADRGHGPAPAPVGAGEDGRGWPQAEHRADRQQPGAAGRGDRPGGPAPQGGAGGLLRLVLGGGRAGGGRRRGAPGPPAGGQGLQPPPGQERRARCPRPGRPAADGPAGGGVDRPGGDPRAAGDHQVPRQAGPAADQLQGPGPRGAGQAGHRGDLPGASSAPGDPGGWMSCRCPSRIPGRSPRCAS